MAPTIHSLIKRVWRYEALQGDAPGPDELAQWLHSNRVGEAAEAIDQSRKALKDMLDGDPVFACFRFDGNGMEQIENLTKTAVVVDSVEPFSVWMAIEESNRPPDLFASPIEATREPQPAFAERIDRLWKIDSEGVSNPLAPLLRAFSSKLARERIKPDQKRGRILPHGVFHRRPSTKFYVEDRTRVPLPAMPGLQHRQADLFAHLDLPTPPVLLLLDAAGLGGHLVRGTGARKDKRLLIFGLVEMPLSQRGPDTIFEWCPTVDHLIALFYPRGGDAGKSSWQPSKHASQLEAAFDGLSLAKVVLENGSVWRLAVTRKTPNWYERDDCAIVEIRLPPGSAHGPRIDHQGLVADGVISDPAFDLGIGLAYEWDRAKAKNAGIRVYATRPVVRRDEHGVLIDHDGKRIVDRHGQPITRWNHRGAVTIGTERNPHWKRVRGLNSEGRRQLAYGPKPPRDPGQRARQCRNADKLLRRLEHDGRVAIQCDGPIWHVLEPWVGSN